MLQSSWTPGSNWNPRQGFPVLSPPLGRPSLEPESLQMWLEAIWYAGRCDLTRQDQCKRTLPDSCTLRKIITPAVAKSYTFLCSCLYFWAPFFPNIHDTKAGRTCVHTGPPGEGSLLGHHGSEGPDPAPRMPLLVNTEAPSGPWEAYCQPNSSWLSQWKMHLHLANANVTGLFKIPVDFNCRKLLKFKSLIVFFCSWSWARKWDQTRV